MRTPLLAFLILAVFVSKAQSITITNSSGTSTITCETPSINLTASCVGFSTAASFTWFSSLATFSGSNVTIGLPNTYTVAIYNGTVLVTQTVLISANILQPISSISSTFAFIIGTSAPTITLAALSPTTNFVHYIYPPIGGTIASISATIAYQPSSSGTYTHCFVSTLNGCSSCKIFIISYIPDWIRENFTDAALKIHNDPSGDIVITGTREIPLQLNDLNGRCLLNLNLDQKNNYLAKITGLKPGLYILISETERKKYKIVVEAKD